VNGRRRKKELVYKETLGKKRIPRTWKDSTREGSNIKFKICQESK
jgi:hypothetical protein